MYIVVPYIAATLHIYLCKILSPPTLLVQPVRLHISIDHLILFISFLSLSLSLYFHVVLLVFFLYSFILLLQVFYNGPPSPIDFVQTEIIKQFK